MFPPRNASSTNPNNTVYISFIICQGYWNPILRQTDRATVPVIKHSQSYHSVVFYHSVRKNLSVKVIQKMIP